MNLSNVVKVRIAALIAVAYAGYLVWGLAALYRWACPRQPVSTRGAHD